MVYAMLPTLKKDASLRLKTIRGHLEGVQKMVDEEAYCVEIMKQVAAIQASHERVNQIVLRNHLHTGFSDAIKSGSGDDKIEELMDALKYNKQLTDGRYVADLPAERAIGGGQGQAETVHARGRH